MSKCYKCGNELAPNMKFCVSCGAKILRCPSCGSIISKRSERCAVDGKLFPPEILAELGVEPTGTVKRPDVPRPPVNKPAGGNRKIIVLSAVLVLLLAVLFAVIYWFFLRTPETTPGTVDPATSVTEEENTEPEQPAEEAAADNEENNVAAREYDHTAAGFVTRLYVELLGREPDESGLDAWTEMLENGEMTGADAVIGMCGSDEFAERGLSNEKIMRCLYLAALGREPDESGLEAWAGFLDNGMPLTEVAAEFTSCDEFAEVCNEFGIQ